MLGFGSQAFICGFSRQNIDSVHTVQIQLVFGPTCAEPIYVDWRRYRVVNSLLCRDNPLCVLIIPRNMSTQRFSSRLELISRMLDILETDLIQVPLTVNALLLPTIHINVYSFYWFLDTLLYGPTIDSFYVLYAAGYNRTLTCVIFMYKFESYFVNS